MSPRTTSQDQPGAASPRRRSRQASAGDAAEVHNDEATNRPPGEPSAAGDPAEPLDDPGEQDIAASLSFRDAQTALELSLAELQAADLDVEEMAGLYRRASRYADRCEQLLQRVEQEVMQWDPGQPQDAPLPYQPS